MALMFTAKVQASGGPFLPTSFQDLMQKTIMLPGLDPSWQHVLVDAQVLPDGSAALLAVVSSPPAVAQIDNAVRLISGTPAAYVRVVDDAGKTLAEGSYSAPLQAGQEIAIGEKHYFVTAASWPGRDPVTGICTGDIDWQHAIVGPPLPAVDLTPVAADSR